ncbi:peptide/nickel transport system ATP-binding protein [Rhizobium sp. RU33A]|uniref:ATP-binding cassette domain-containing protein n=1 Tax=Rhizobium sp. RU33A TaxID=1907413 RepID=UPI0009554C28|nr:ATP-binding cassette domain-containing protein [Rhizobium sp. RU33A]SIQ17343.1 peptide/nickel transport system ATP-binding protein [Rhizobium sp. RU33A]
MLSVESLSIGFLRYDGLIHRCEVPALDGIDLKVDRGEIIALVGASGAGKSLLAHALFGILPENAVVRGSISLNGEPVEAANGGKGPRMALVPQSLSHLDPLARCGKQLLWAAQRGGKTKTMADLVTTLESFGLDAEVMRLYPHQVSGGMARRLLLAIATIGEPDLIVADEPTRGLDPNAADNVLRHLRRLADRGKAVLLITHDLVTAVSHADRVAILEQGRLLGIEPANAFSEDGRRLTLPYARALWLAMPGNQFTTAPLEWEAARA